jgi:hypothetical protein
MAAAANASDGIPLADFGFKFNPEGMDTNYTGLCGKPKPGTKTGKGKAPVTGKAGSVISDFKTQIGCFGTNRQKYFQNFKNARSCFKRRLATMTSEEFRKYNDDGIEKRISHAFPVAAAYGFATNCIGKLYSHDDEKKNKAMSYFVDSAEEALDKADELVPDTAEGIGIKSAILENGTYRTLQEKVEKNYDLRDLFVRFSRAGTGTGGAAAAAAAADDGDGGDSGDWVDVGKGGKTVKGKRGKKTRKTRRAHSTRRRRNI